MRILRAAEHRRMAWKNGGGETLEVAVYPEGGALADFDWRVSIATVAAGGLFSAFPGVDRTLTLLSGDGMELSIDGHGTHVLLPGSAPLPFPGDATTSARLVGSPITDLNVMTRRGAFTHRVMPLDAAHTTAGTVLVAAAEASVLTVDGDAVRLDALDVCGLGDGPVTLARESGRLLVIEIAAAARADRPRTRSRW